MKSRVVGFALPESRITPSRIACRPLIDARSSSENVMSTDTLAAGVHIALPAAAWGDALAANDGPG